jgi:hypothetical protein
MPAEIAENRVGEEVTARPGPPRISKIDDHRPPAQLPTYVASSQFSNGIRARHDRVCTTFPTRISVMKG